MHEVKTNVDEFPILCQLSIRFIPESKLELKCAFNLMMGLECAPNLLLESKRDQCCSCSFHRFWYLVQSMMNRYEYFSIMRKKNYWTDKIGIAQFLILRLNVLVLNMNGFEILVKNIIIKGLGVWRTMLKVEIRPNLLFKTRIHPMSPVNT
jgi:hypothetical protein